MATALGVPNKPNQQDTKSPARFSQGFLLVVGGGMGDKGDKGDKGLNDLKVLNAPITPISLSYPSSPRQVGTIDSNNG